MADTEDRGAHSLRILVIFRHNVYALLCMSYFVQTISHNGQLYTSLVLPTILILTVSKMSLSGFEKHTKFVSSTGPSAAIRSRFFAP